MREDLIVLLEKSECFVCKWHELDIQIIGPVCTDGHHMLGNNLRFLHWWSRRFHTFNVLTVCFSVMLWHKKTVLPKFEIVLDIFVKTINFAEGRALNHSLLSHFVKILEMNMQFYIFRHRRPLALTWEGFHPLLRTARTNLNLFEGTPLWSTWNRAEIERIQSIFSVFEWLTILCYIYCEMRLLIRKQFRFNTLFVIFSLIDRAVVTYPSIIFSTWRP